MARWAGSVQVGPAATTSSGADASSRATARLSVGRPTTSTRSGRCAAGNPPRSSRSPPGSTPGPGCEPRARLGHDRPAAGLGQRHRRRGLRRRRVPEHHDRTGRQVIGDRPRRRRRHHLGPRPAAGPPGQRLRPVLPCRRHQRLPQRQVQVHRPAGRDRPAHRRAPVRVLPDPGLRRPQLDEPRRRAEQADLVDRSGSRRSRAAPAAGRRSARAAGRRRAPPPAPPGAGSPPPCRTWSPPATGRPDAFASPSARNPADRSSMRTCSRSRPAASAACSANASGAEREPGASTASRTPHRTSSSTSTRRQRGRRVHARRPRPAGSWQRRSRSSRPGPRGPRGAASAASRSGSGADRAAPASRPPSGSRAAAAVDVARPSSPTVASPQAYGSSGSAAASASPGGDPDRRVQRAGDHHRQPAVGRDPQRRPDPAERGDLEHDDVGRLGAARPAAGRRPRGSHSSAATGTVPASCRRSAASSSTVRARLLDVLQARTARAAGQRVDRGRRPSSRRWRRPGSARPGPSSVTDRRDPGHVVGQAPGRARRP